MKKLLLLLTIMLAFSCSNDDYNYTEPTNFNIKYFSTQLWSNYGGGYTVSMLVTVQTYGKHNVKGHVLFHTKEYGTVRSETMELKYNEKDNIMIEAFEGQIQIPNKIDNFHYTAEFIKE